MWKITSIVAMFLISFPASAQAMPEQAGNERMLETVRRLYAGYLPSSIRPYSDIKHALTPEFRRILDRENRASIAMQGMACIDYDLSGLTDGDEETGNLIRHSLRITQQSSKVVRASFRQSRDHAPTVVYYKMVCNNNHCLIDDIAYSTPNNSLRREVSTCLRRYGY